jgi:hypothetical protein
MSLKSYVIALGVAAVGLAAVPVARAGGDYVEPETAPAPRYNYAPRQEPIYDAPAVYVPRPVVSIGFYPAFGFYGRPYGYYGGYYRSYWGHRYYGGRGGHWVGSHRR